jgi:hypothetical protein
MRVPLPLLLVTLITLTAPLAAQQSSVYVPLQHWAMPYVEHLITVGVLADPTPLTRPLRQADLVRALTRVHVDSLRGPAARMVRRLLDEFTEPPGNRYRVDADAGVATATDPYRDPLEIGRGVPPRPSGPGHLFGMGGVAAQAVFGPVVAATHTYDDTRLRFDPDWYDTRRNGMRIAEAYVDAQWRYAGLFFGILDRNWGPSGVQGLLLSDNPYSMDYFGLTLGTPTIQLQAIGTELDPLTDTSGAVVNRYMVQRRLYVRPRGRWTFAVWEGSVWSGVGRQAEPWYLNLMGLNWIVANYAGSGNVNLFEGLEFERRGAVTLFGQFMLDDVQYQRESASDLKPVSYGLTVGAKGRLSHIAWTAFYTQVANLTYRNEDDQQVPLFHALSTGRNFADYDQATAKLGLLTGNGVLLEPEVTVLRQGEGDPHLPHPLVPQYPTTPVLFQGVVERTVRLALGATWQWRGLSVSGNGGVHLVHNADHTPGVSKTDWVGSIGLTWRAHLADALP